MRQLAYAALALVATIAPTRAPAQTYGSNYPVCLHVYGPVSYFECRYTSIAQCNQTASGRAAQCVINPYAAGPERGPGRYRRYDRMY